MDVDDQAAPPGLTVQINQALQPEPVNVPPPMRPAAPVVEREQFAEAEIPPHAQQRAPAIQQAAAQVQPGAAVPIPPAAQVRGGFPVGEAVADQGAHGCEFRNLSVSCNHTN
ncbi:hypothetical protein QAD02_018109 [Eretmocerus hayati]|uniref:Uncharacterized protein n=1 Tax=Eretmocerus hayati TaxID=131215 RepID=A0ACC2PIU7_9HYME|nr:hypothetical protein QAD02_018109 [Eretmocerus hayati]